MGMSAQLHHNLTKLVGTWRAKGRIIEGGEQHGTTWAGYDSYEWFPGEQQMFHRVDVEIFGNRKEAMEVFSSRPGGDEFDQISFDADGSVERAIGSFDERGRYHNDLKAARATVTFHGEDSMTALWETRGPNGIWSNWMEISFTRVGPPHIEIRSQNRHIDPKAV